MSLFLSTFVNKLDKKGRVSIPATFRQALIQTGFQGIVAFPSFTQASIDCGGMDRMQRLSEGADDLPAFSAEQDDLATLIFASSHQLPFDGEGRVVLPEDLVTHAGLVEAAAIVGLGKTFQIWEPEAFKAFRAEAMKRAKEKRPTMKLGGGS